MAIEMKTWVVIQINNRKPKAMEEAALAGEVKYVQHRVPADPDVMEEREASPSAVLANVLRRRGYRLLLILQPSIILLLWSPDFCREDERRRGGGTTRER